MQEQIDSLLKEGKQFLQIKKDYDTSRFPNSGTPAYIISQKWFTKYKAYCFYEELKYNTQPNIEEDHFSPDKKPGMIINQKLLHHEQDKFLQGTGTINEFEADVFDRYLHKDVRERIDFEFINEELWQFLKSRYGCDYVIKRYYMQKGYLSEIDARMQLIPTFMVRSEDLYAGQITEETFKVSYVQISSKKSFSDLKKRMADVISAQLQQVQEGGPEAEAPTVNAQGIRLWLADDKAKLLSSF